jgi:NADPH-dependent glutamate synthase beta subunit-like oxidoreductase
MLLKASLQSFRLAISSYSSSATSIPQIAIIGGGPAGFYTAHQLLKARSQKLFAIC